MQPNESGLRMSWASAWGYLISLPHQYQKKMATLLDKELIHWLPFTPLYVQYEVLESAPLSVIESFEKRRVRYSKPTKDLDAAGKPVVETGYMPVVNPQVAERIKAERNGGDVVWDVKIRKRRKRRP